MAEYVKPFTQETVELMAQSYNAEPHETALELAKTYYTLLGKITYTLYRYINIMFSFNINDEENVCSISGKDPECQGLLINLFASLMSKTLQHVQSTGNMSDHSELISTFFR